MEIVIAPQPRGANGAHCSGSGKGRQHNPPTDPVQDDRSDVVAQRPAHHLGRQPTDVGGLDTRRCQRPTPVTVTAAAGNAALIEHQ